MLKSNIAQSGTKKFNPSILLCPFCFKVIPTIVLKGTKDNVKVQIECLCLKKEKKELSLNAYLKALQIYKPNEEYCSLSKDHSNAPMKFYCGICNLRFCGECSISHQNISINHQVTLEVISIPSRCKDHPDKRLKYHCSRCKKDYCSICKESKCSYDLLSKTEEHSITKQVEFNWSLNQSILKSIDDSEAELKRKTTALTTKLEKAIELLSQSLKEIRSLYDKTTKSNALIKEFAERLLLTYENTKSFSCYSLNTQLSSCLSNKDLLLPKEVSYNSITNNFLDYFESFRNSTQNTLFHSKSRSDYLTMSLYRKSFQLKTERIYKNEYKPFNTLPSSSSTSKLIEK